MEWRILVIMECQQERIVIENDLVIDALPGLMDGSPFAA